MAQKMLQHAPTQTHTAARWAPRYSDTTKAMSMAVHRRAVLYALCSYIISIIILE